MNSNRLFPSIFLAMLLASGNLAAEGLTEMKKGKGGTEVQGAAGTSGSTGDSGLEHCDKPMGAMAVVEPQDYVMAALSQYNLQSPVGIIRMMIQQSNCFIVVERGQKWATKARTQFAQCVGFPLEHRARGGKVLVPQYWFAHE